MRRCAKRSARPVVLRVAFPQPAGNTPFQPRAPRAWPVRPRAKLTQLQGRRPERQARLPTQRRAPSPASPRTLIRDGRGPNMDANQPAAPNSPGGVDLRADPAPPDEKRPRTFRDRVVGGLILA